MNEVHSFETLGHEKLDATQRNKPEDQNLQLQAVETSNMEIVSLFEKLN